MDEMVLSSLTNLFFAFSFGQFNGIIICCPCTSLVSLDLTHDVVFL